MWSDKLYKSKDFSSPKEPTLMMCVPGDTEVVSCCLRWFLALEGKALGKVGKKDKGSSVKYIYKCSDSSCPWYVLLARPDKKEDW